MSYKFLIQLAIKNVHLVSVHKSKHFCFIFKNGSLCTFGLNCRIFFQTKDGKTKYSKHAEEVAIDRLKALTRNTRFNPRHYSIVNIRINSKGELRNSKPCSGCKSIIDEIGIKKVYASTDAGNIIKV